LDLISFTLNVTLKLLSDRGDRLCLGLDLRAFQPCLEDSGFGVLLGLHALGVDLLAMHGRLVLRCLCKLLRLSARLRDGVGSLPSKNFLLMLSLVNGRPCLSDDDRIGLRRKALVELLVSLCEVQVA